MKRLLLLGAAALGMLPLCAEAREYSRHGHHDNHSRYSGHRHSDHRHGDYRYSGHRYGGQRYGDHRHYDGGYSSRQQTFRVYIRPRGCNDWRLHASYGCQSDADFAYRGLCSGGYEARIACD